MRNDYNMRPRMSFKKGGRVKMEKGGEVDTLIEQGVPDRILPSKSNEQVIREIDDEMEKRKKPGKKNVSIKPKGVLNFDVRNLNEPQNYKMGGKVKGKKGFPDLTGDGKVTFKDILKGRGVIKKKGGMIKKGMKK